MVLRPSFSLSKYHSFLVVPLLISSSFAHVQVSHILREMNKCADFKNQASFLSVAEIVSQNNFSHQLVNLVISYENYSLYIYIYLK